MKGPHFYNYAAGFERHEAYSSSIDANDDTARLLAATTSDHVFGRGEMLELTADDRETYLEGFDAIYARAARNELPTSDVENVDYYFKRFGTWE